MPNIFDNITDDTRLEVGSGRLPEGLRHRRCGHRLLRPARPDHRFADIIDTKAIPAPGARATARILVGMIAPAEPEQLLDSLQDQVQPPAYAPTSTTAKRPSPDATASSSTFALN